MRALLSLLLVASPALAEVAGAYPNDAEGITYLTAEKGSCPGSTKTVVATNSNKAPINSGCYGIHNGLSVVILWHRGPASLVPVSSVTWFEIEDKEPPKKTS